jgi:hypothetical protein
MNDLLDAEQLVYLGAPELRFLTCDRGFERVTKSEQARRIFVVAMADVSDARRLEALLREIVE